MSMDTKLRVVMELQRSHNWFQPPAAAASAALPRHNIQPSQVSATDQSAYSAASVYDALLFGQQFGQPVAMPPQPFVGYPNGGITASYLDQQRLAAQESDSVTGEQCFYNDEDYQDNGLGYEIPPNYLPLSSQELFLSGGDASRSAATAPILPGFFSSSVKQCLSDRTSGVTSDAVTQSAGVNLVMATTAVAKSEAAAISQSDISATPKPMPVVADPSSSTPSFPPANTQSLTESTSPLAAPKFVFSNLAAAAVTTAASAAATASETKTTDSSSKTLFGGFSFTAAPPVTLADQSKDEKKATICTTDKAASKPDNPFANFSFSSPGALKADDKVAAEKVISKPSFGVVNGVGTSTSTPVSVGNKLAGSELPVFGSGTKATRTSFASLAHQETKGFTKKADDSSLFNATMEELFQQSTAKSPGSARKANLSGGQEDIEEYVPDQEFQPLVSLPEVEVRTGEEDEEKLFGERAKLYRMDVDSKQWKERGIGEMKILRHRTAGRFRIVMRREQVLKLCANHYITAAMKLVPMQTSETSLCWVASDYSEGEMQKEQLCVKFKTTDLAQKFRICFEECQQKCGEQKTASEAQSSADGQSAESEDANKPLSSLFKPKSGQWVCSGCYITNESDNATCIACMTPKPDAVPVSVEQPPSVSTSSDAPSLSSLFQAKAGEWDCASCYVRNGADRTVCAACETPKPGTTVVADNVLPSKKSDSAFQLAPGGGFTFSGLSGKPFTFGAAAASASTGSDQPAATSTVVTSGSCGFTVSFGFKPSLTTGTTTSSVATPPLFTFGSPQVGLSSIKPGANMFQSLSKASVTTSSSTSIFQGSSSTPSFALLSSTPKAVSAKTDENKVPFGSQSFVFEGVKPVSSLSSLTKAGTGSPFKFSSATPATPPAQSTAVPPSPQSPENELYEYGTDDEPNVSFEPVVRLPDNVEVKTGEEDEDVLYSQRAKLYRFVDNEWKERGTGDVKILQHRSTGIVRVVMRRERVLKLCLNHRITPAQVLQPMPNAQGKAWTWHANDFSDGAEPTHEKFSIRFKTEDIASEFKQAFDGAKSDAEVLPLVKSSGSKGAGAAQCSGPSILEELLAADSSSEHRGKVFYISLHFLASMITK